jgi:hypothetical protein
MTTLFARQHDKTISHFKQLLRAWVTQMRWLIYLDLTKNICMTSHDVRGGNRENVMLVIIIINNIYSRAINLVNTETNGYGIGPDKI